MRNECDGRPSPTFCISDPSSDRAELGLCPRERRIVRWPDRRRSKCIRPNPLRPRKCLSRIPRLECDSEAGPGEVDAQRTGCSPDLECSENRAIRFEETEPVAQSSLGRPLAGNVQNVTINLVQPGTLYGDRVNELDLRFAKLLRFGNTRTRISLDLYNALNSAAVLSYNQTFNPATTTWLTPTSVLAARVAKIGASIEF